MLNSQFVNYHGYDYPGTVLQELPLLRRQQRGGGMSRRRATATANCSDGMSRDKDELRRNDQLVPSSWSKRYRHVQSGGVVWF